MFFSNFHKNNDDMFLSRVIRRTREAPEIKMPEMPPPQTRAEAREQNKRRYLPAERLQIQLNKQVKREKEKNRLNDDDIDKIVESMGRVMNNLKL